MHDQLRQSVFFPDAFQKPVTMRFIVDGQTSDGGALLLALAEQKLGLIDAMSMAIHDQRQPGKIDHSIQDLLAQRMFSIACGYPDGNDATVLRDDPVLKIMRQLLPGSDKGLASQPTLSRFENAVTRADLYRMGECLLDLVIKAAVRKHGRNSSLITIDLDPTDDPTHGAQQLTFFNGHYDSWCYLPMPGFLSFNGDPEMYLFTVLLRPGNAKPSLGAVPLFKRVLPKLKESFPKAKIRVRLDGGFATPEILDFLEGQPRVEYLINLPKNRRLEALAKPLMKKARKLSKKSRQTEHVFGETRYAAGTWNGAKRRVVIKAEVVHASEKEPRDNPRFVVTNMRHAPEGLYQIYRDRAECENRIKELHHGLEIDRTSCSRFLANQFRNLLTAAAYMLFQEIRWSARGTTLQRVQVSGLREKLLKIGARVIESARRIVLDCPKAYPWNLDFNVVARRLQMSRC